MAGLRNGRGQRAFLIWKGHRTRKGEGELKGKGMGEMEDDRADWGKVQKVESEKGRDRNEMNYGTGARGKGRNGNE